MCTGVRQRRGRPDGNDGRRWCICAQKRMMLTDVQVHTHHTHTASILATRTENDEVTHATVIAASELGLHFRMIRFSYFAIFTPSPHTGVAIVTDCIRFCVARVHIHCTADNFNRSGGGRQTRTGRDKHKKNMKEISASTRALSDGLVTFVIHLHYYLCIPKYCAHRLAMLFTCTARSRVEHKLLR